eukprot:jgi/Mesvir1/21626/Mv04048-RA.1
MKVGIVLAAAVLCFVAVACNADEGGDPRKAVFLEMQEKMREARTIEERAAAVVEMRAKMASLPMAHEGADGGRSRALKREGGERDFFTHPGLMGLDPRETGPDPNIPSAVDFNVEGSKMAREMVANAARSMGSFPGRTGGMPGAWGANMDGQRHQETLDRMDAVIAKMRAMGNEKAAAQVEAQRAHFEKLERGGAKLPAAMAEKLGLKDGEEGRKEL